MAETFGKTTATDTLVIASGGLINAIRFQSGSAGTLASITLFVKYDGAAGKVKCAIYKDDFYLVDDGTTEEKEFDIGQNDWMTFNFSTPPSVLASTYYRLAWWPNVFFRSWRESGETDQRAYRSLTYDGWPNPLTSLGGYTDMAWAIYATYEEAPPAAKTLVQAALISIPPLIALPTLGQILKFAGVC